MDELSQFRKTDTPKGRRGRPPKVPNSSSPDRYKLKINFDKKTQMSIEAPEKRVQVAEETINP